MRKVLPVLFFLLSVPLFTPASEAPPLLLHGVIQRVRESLDTERDYGYYQKVNVRKLDSDSSIDNEEVRVYRTTWIEGKPFAALVTINNKPPAGDEKLKEWGRRSDFIKSLHGSSDQQGMYQELQAIQWDDLYKSYSFQLLGTDANGLQMVSFRPSGQAKDRTRFEKVFHRLEGTLWLDANQNVVRASARLMEPVKFGWGIFAKVDEMQVQFQQQKHLSVWAPARVLLRFKARVALIKTIRQEIEVAWFDPFPKPPLLQTAEELKAGETAGIGHQ